MQQRLRSALGPAHELATAGNRKVPLPRVQPNSKEETGKVPEGLGGQRR